jgi:hypothetical protein
MGISVSIGDPLPLSSLRGTSTGGAGGDGQGTGGDGQGTRRKIVPVPVVPENC